MVRVLVFNVGSSSIKYSLFENTQKLDSGYYERLKEKKDYQKAVEDILQKIGNIDLISHRIVHGGDLNKPTKITKETIKKIQEFSHFAPLHNPKQLMVIKICEKFKKPQYAVFDTAFYSPLPKISKVYPIPTEITKKYNIRKYGFHGLSHKFVSTGLNGKTISCHLGSGSSITAIKNSKPIDTSMGLTPLEGLMMTTRSGTIDPGLIIFLEKKGYNPEKLLQEKSGFLGLSGYKDFRDILKTQNKKSSKLTYDIFVYQITKIIGSYVAALNGLDNLIFTAAIGENVPKLRNDICKNLEFLGLKLDEKENQKNSKIISGKNSKVKVYVIPTNEELEIVKEVLKK